MKFSHPIKIINYELPINSFLTINLSNITFEECHFQNTSLNNSTIVNCNFIKCQFDRIEINHSTIFKQVKIVDCEISTVYDTSKEKGYYDKYSIELFLKSKGITIESSFHEKDIKETLAIVDDEELELVEKALRRFIRIKQSYK